MKSNKVKLVAALGFLLFACISAFCLLSTFIPNFPDISKIINSRITESKYINTAIELCKDTSFVDQIHDAACNDLISAQEYGKYSIASRKMEKVIINNSSRVYIYKRLILGVGGSDTVCPTCGLDSTKNRYYFSFQIGENFVDEIHFDIKDQNKITDLNEDLLKVQENGDRYSWILFYNPNIFDTYQLFSFDLTTNRIENLEIKFDGNPTNIKLDPNNNKITYSSNNENKSINIDLDSSTEIRYNFGEGYPLRESIGITLKDSDYDNIKKDDQGYTIFSFRLAGPFEGFIRPQIMYYSIVPTNSVYNDFNVATTIPAPDNYSGLKKIGITYEDLKVILNNLPAGQKLTWAKQISDPTKSKFVFPPEKSIREIENVCKLNELVCDFEFN